VRVTFVIIMKPNRCTNFSNLFWNETLQVSDSSSVHHQQFFAVQTAMVYVIQFCRQLASRLSLLASSLRNCVYCCVYSKNFRWWTEELSKTCRVSFQNKFEILVHLVGFIIRICHNARSHERKRWHLYSVLWLLMQAKKSITLANVLRFVRTGLHLRVIVLHFLVSRHFYWILFLSNWTCDLPLFCWLCYEIRELTFLWLLFLIRYLTVKTHWLCLSLQH
jgi:hypothetical protein